MSTVLFPVAGGRTHCTNLMGSVKPVVLTAPGDRAARILAGNLVPHATSTCDRAGMPSGFPTPQACVLPSAEPPPLVISRMARITPFGPNSAQTRGCSFLQPEGLERGSRCNRANDDIHRQMCRQAAACRVVRGACCTLLRCYSIRTCRSGGMADALDSKSSVLRDVWVQLPPPVLFARKGVRAVRS